ncbi:hypothetical protein FOYG_10532 [Fusarium oxysporum NRRL 32931]|uniref:Transcription factor domain-containing protein n=1 Tax=Fusarium oxysporum NRRL 32931 TaxID=660029 RepID=W9I051_FUSOX|nr:hypothetical protein FOYG_10532 [Fusarium oxysporum NRRL 32931]
MGLHRGLNTGETAQQPHQARISWTMYWFQGLVSLAAGLPPSLDRRYINLPKPQQPDYDGAMVELSDIMSTIHMLYRDHRTSINADLRAAHGIARNLQAFAKARKVFNLDNLHDSNHYDNTRTVEHVIISYSQ